MSQAIGLQSLNDDILSIIVTAWLSQRDAANLALTSRTVSTVARRRVLSSLRLTAPVASSRFHRFMLKEDSGFRLHCLQKLSIFRSNLSEVEPDDGYTPLARVLERARNLRTLVVTYVEDHLETSKGDVLGDAIASLRDLQELDLHDVGEEGMALCERLTCKPRAVHLRASCSSFEPHLEVEHTAFAELPVLQAASVVTLQNFTFVSLADDDSEPPPPPGPLPAPTNLWLDTHTLHLRNVDPMAVVKLCPNLSYLHMTFVMLAHDGRDFYPGDWDNAYSTTIGLVPDIIARLRVLDVFVDNPESILDKTIVASVRATHPVVLSMQFHYGDKGLWEQLAELAKGPQARLRYLDVLLHDDPLLAQKWLDECLPLFSDSNLLCVGLRLVEYIGDTITAQKYSVLEASPDDSNWIEDSEWEGLWDTAPKVLAEVIPSLRYVAVSSGCMVEGRVDREQSTFRGKARWWRVVRDNSKANPGTPAGAATGAEDGMAPAELTEINGEEGRGMDQYMRGEVFADTLRLNE
ncbi:uncharacterized protein B0H18DRAFT_1122443 [Fomitopsis serialis]|uniref:uncharacterized protein n=1 Tax=Fomitopsis serialis TaxID=139415 RepID=UPI002008B6B7|nr:uncharacterized protein B0H18DRAFT_1122443 [Neoantrodia serialis]KAH9919521.1 hypothetical protein B0H18DRAFT_1122443 [Neoantrodia serialis]